MRPTRESGTRSITTASARPSSRTRLGWWAGFHTFRHTCAGLLCDHGLNVRQVQRWLGHHSPSFTLDTYVHLLDERLPEPVDLTKKSAAAKGAEALPF